ncbi:hypothetical protein AEP_00071 [Curvibacter sp. AEP1-3]|uniref:AlbA family DNA-binding domain-containing protein n=1 Tax=Curvibacter sp. AEP1-3 TaxID=1844971 RepID=UPI000B3CA053|nr:ATP-binding protein [Curvibacter sp. AEP1-3]ARV17037.1 hypothetical protein AEP_00071 [Curvibacter sp. AEP1-3]
MLEFNQKLASDSNSNSNLNSLIFTSMNPVDHLPPWADSAASQRLPKLCSQGEGQQVEFKERLPSQGHDIGKSIAAFASSNNGVILYGISNDGSVVGIENGHDSEIRDSVSQRVSNASKEVRPPVNPTVTWAYHDGKVVCFVEVERGSEAIYYSNHRPILRRGCISRPAEPSEVELAFRSRFSPKPQAQALPSSRQIAERMSSVLEKMNSNRVEPLAVSDLALAMGFSSPAEFEAVLVGQAPATFDLIDEFCTCFAVNKEWLKTGRRSPFFPEIEHRSNPEQCLELIDAAECETVYAVRSKSVVGETFLVIESNALKFWLIPDVWHVSDHVGGKGASDLASLYKLFKYWANGNSPYTVLGRYIEPKLAESIWNGLTYPGVIADMPLSHWWDDLTDLDHNWTSRKGALKAYGKQFVSAQDIIRRLIAQQ